LEYIGATLSTKAVDIGYKQTVDLNRI